jgi:glycosyltransferase involved in cell wall biosynthesis
MEYMIFKKPIVSFALKESMYTLQKAGMYVYQNDTDKMAQCVIELIENEEFRKKMGEEAKRRVKELTWDKVSMPLIDAYNKLRKN